MRAKEFVKENSLSLFFLAIFLAALVGQAIAGHNLHNQEATVWLRQKGSPGSKPVGAPLHDATGQEG